MKTFLFLIALSFTFATTPSDVLQALGDLANIKPSTSLSGDAKICLKGFKWPGDSIQGCEGPDFEMSNGVCYEACKSGYLGFGSFCMGKNLPAYSRQRIDLNEMTGICPIRFLKVDNTCVALECPKEFPSQCGLFCAKDDQTCSSEVTKFTFLIMKFLYQLSGEKWSEALITLNEVKNVLKSLPECDTYTNQKEKVDMNRLIDLIRQMI